MSDAIKHECGIAVVRLLKPLSYYRKKYGTPLYGLNKLYLLMQKQRNRGQDGAGVASVKFDPKVGTTFIDRLRSNKSQPLKDLFGKIYGNFNEVDEDKFKDTKWAKENLPFIGEVYLGHLRYGTHGGNNISFCHPIIRENNWINRNLILAGNFNLTNVDELFEHLVELGQHPKGKSDTVTILEKIGHFLDFEVQHLFNGFNADDGVSNQDITKKINYQLNIANILKRSFKRLDGGYAIGGIIGNGDSFVVRDPNGIRPAYYYQDDEIVMVASERPAIMTTIKAKYNEVREIPPAHALIIKKDGRISLKSFVKKQPLKACSFERIYFSRGTDKDIYKERKKLGYQLAKPVLKMVDYDFENTVFSFVPNTAEVAFYGMMNGLEDELNKIKLEKIQALGKKIKTKELEKILALRARQEKIAVKDAKLRTFISEGATRNELVSHVYDVTYGIVKNNVDTLVLIDDSIVRGTTLEQSIIKIVARLKPKRILIVSSAPQIRYPDCYGIDMSKMKNFVAFRALIALLKQTGQESALTAAYHRCKLQESLNDMQVKNEVKSLYALFGYEQISRMIAKIVKADGIKPRVDVLYQTLDGLHKACPNHTGDWYFSGNYPTPGGNRVANRAFVHYMEGVDARAY